MIQRYVLCLDNSDGVIDYEIKGELFKKTVILIKMRLIHKEELHIRESI